MSTVLGASDPGPGMGLRLEMCLFGPMEVRVDARPLPRLRSRKGLWLLSLLALRAGRDVDRSWVAGTLWPGADAEHGRRSLRQSLHDLRLALGSDAYRLACDAPCTLRLDLRGATLDVQAFDDAIAAGDLESLKYAVRLYRGPLLEDCSEEWVLEDRRRRELAYVYALATLAAGVAAQGDLASEARYLRLAATADPFNEELRCALMRNLSLCGNAGAALNVYTDLRALLWRELTVEPAEETTALFRKLRAETRARAAPRSRGKASAGAVDPGPLAHAPAAPSPAVSEGAPRATRHLPLPLTELIGRDLEVREVITRLGSGRLVTLTGTGGIGKTRLSLQVAEELAARFSDGVRFVDLAPVADPARVVDAVRSALEISSDDGREEPLQVVRRYLSGRRLLLVLDNCEHLLDACAAVAHALLQHCEGLHILATSRQVLGVHGEVVWRVPSLPVPVETGSSRTEGRPRQVTVDAAALEAYPSVRLFLERARSVKPLFEITARNALAVAEVCRRLDGIPLALELAAARVGAMPVEAIALRLDDRFRILNGGSRTALPRQQTLRATLDWSYDLLTPTERVLMRRLSVFAGGWTLEAAQAVCESAEVQPRESESPSPAPVLSDHEVFDSLTALVEKSLVLYEEQAQGGRYRLLETVRQYFRERLQAEGEEAAVLGRHLGYFVQYAEEADRQLTGAGQDDWLERLETDYDDLVAALDWSLSPSAIHGDPSHVEKGLRLAGALGHFWLIRGYLTEGRQRLRQALDLAPPSSQARGAAATAAGNLAHRQGDYEAAQAMHEEALAISRRDGREARVAASLTNLGIIALARTDLASARSLWEEALSLRREHGDRWELASSLHNLGALAIVQEDFEAARPLLEEGLAIRRELGDHWVIAGSLHNLGLVAHGQGDYAAARALHKESLALRRDLRAPVGVADSLEALGDAICALCTEGQAGGDTAAMAARLVGAAASLREAVHAPLPRSEQEGLDRQIARTRAFLGERVFEAAWEQGRAMAWERAVAYALGESPKAFTQCGGRVASKDTVSKR
jgi:predicted ATPase/DNA-binding SARP family transcriptional activator